MRGYPLLQLLLVGCLFAAAGFPVWKVTHPAPAAQAFAADAAPAPAASPDAAGDRVQKVLVGFSSAPADFRVSYLGKTVLEGRGPQVDFVADASVDIPKDGADFALEVHWPAPAVDAAPAAGHAAVHVAFKLSGRTVEQTLWSDAKSPLVELVTVTP